MDLFDCTTRERTANAKHLLSAAKYVNDVIGSPGTVGTPDDRVRYAASSTEYTAQPLGTTEKTPAFPHLLAAFDAAVETVATKTEKKNRDKKGFYYYNNTHFLRRMSLDKRRELKLALHTDAEAIIAAAKRDATDGTPKFFDGVPLRSATTVEVRQDLDAMFQEKQKQLHILQRQINALHKCEDTLKQLDDSHIAAEIFERDTLSLMAVPPPTQTQDADETHPGAAKRAKKQDEA
jgi:hypothetical protein